MNQFFVGNTLINDAYIGNIRVEDVLANPYLEIDYLVVAGGGAGGSTNFTSFFGGGGGAGGLLTGSLTIGKLNTTYQVIVGGPGTGSSGGKAGQNGQNSSLIGGGLSVVTTGGGAGGGTTDSIGKNGGSGGGGAAGGGGGSGVFGQGKDGGVGTSPLGGGGGGATTAGSGILGGSGSLWLNGTEYARGGISSGSATPDIYGAGGRGSGDINQGPQAGKYGNVIIRYPGTGSKATGGTITYSDGYTYHQFFVFGGSYSATSSFTY